MTQANLLVLLLCVLLSACESLNKVVPHGSTKTSDAHIHKESVTQSVADIPKLVTASPSIPLPQPQKKEELFTVVVNNVPIEELLFSLARDAKFNVDIDHDVSGLITLNAINQPLNAILDRVTTSADLIYGFHNNVLRIQADKPFLKNYRVDYINMSRGAQSNVAVSTQINSTGQGAGGGASGGGSGGGNNSSTLVTNSSSNTFWETLQLNISAILYREPVQTNEQAADTGTDAAQAPAPTPTPAEAGGESTNPNIILNKESGIVGVRATYKQHQEIERFLNEVQFSTQRQVLIEATIAEVRLSDRYQAGIDWNLLSGQLGETFNIKQQFTDIALSSRPAFTLQTNNDKGNGESIQGTLSALESFGDVKIMSSPKIMALNNQTALLKVVDNLVYFTVNVSIESGTADANGNSTGLVTYETEVNTVPVGFVMSVTPYISENDSVTLNVRPTISRVIRQARDPNPALAQVGVISEIPVIQVREVESVLKVANGDIAVMGGLMQDEVSKDKRGVPVLSRIPFLGSLFRYDNNLTEKTELVIFIRPLVIKHASVNADLRKFESFLPASPK